MNMASGLFEESDFKVMRNHKHSPPYALQFLPQERQNTLSHYHARITSTN